MERTPSVMTATLSPVPHRISVQFSLSLSSGVGEDLKDEAVPLAFDGGVSLRDDLQTPPQTLDRRFSDHLVPRRARI